MHDHTYTIVVGIDFSAASDHALDEALTLSIQRNAVLHLLHVDNDFRRPASGVDSIE